MSKIWEVYKSFLGMLKSRLNLVNLALFLRKRGIKLVQISLKWTNIRGHFEVFQTTRSVILNTEFGDQEDENH